MFLILKDSKVTTRDVFSIYLKLRKVSETVFDRSELRQYFPNLKPKVVHIEIVYTYIIIDSVQHQDLAVRYTLAYWVR